MKTASAKVGILVLSMVTAFSMFAMQAGAATSLIKNGDFSGAGDWVNTDEYGAKKETAPITISGGKMNFTAAMEDWCAMKQTVTVQPGVTYDITMNYKLSAGCFRLYIYKGGSDAGPTEFETQAKNEGTLNQDVVWKVSYTAKPGETSVDLYIKNKNGADKAVGALDSITMVKQGETVDSSGGDASQDGDASQNGDASQDGGASTGSGGDKSPATGAGFPQAVAAAAAVSLGAVVVMRKKHVCVM